MLFSKVSILDVIQNQKHQIKNKILSLDSNYVLATSEADLVAWLVAEFKIELPTIDESRIHIDYDEKKIDVSQQPMRFIMDRSRPFYVAGTQLTFIIPFDGDGSWFGVQPQNFTYSSGGSLAKIVGNEIQITYEGTDLDANREKRRFDEELRLIKQNYANLSQAVDSRNAELEREISAQIIQRKDKLLKDAQMVSSIGFPIKRRNGEPSTYAVPVQKRKPEIRRPPVPSSRFQPEPVLAMEEYENILTIIRSMVHVMERSPKAFVTMGEEDLRTHFLVQLNGQYEGRATGETFNSQGKTDILIREDDRNVFIAECKIWRGEKQLLEAIDQLLSYLSWRDTKAALLVFSRNTNFTEVLKKIGECAPTHSCYKRALTNPVETSFRFVFHQPNDNNRELILTILAFDIPTEFKSVT